MLFQRIRFLGPLAVVALLAACTQTTAPSPPLRLLIPTALDQVHSRPWKMRSAHAKSMTLNRPVWR